jgi:hypothetical protein
VTPFLSFEEAREAIRTYKLQRQGRVKNFPFLSFPEARGAVRAFWCRPNHLHAAPYLSRLRKAVLSVSIRQPSRA